MQPKNSEVDTNAEKIDHLNALENEYLLKFQNKEDRLRNLLGPFDKFINSLESILVWDYPLVFIILILFINILFWLYTITPFYCLLSFCLFVALLVQFIYNHVWTMVNDSDDSLDGWVKLQATNEDQFDLIRSVTYLLVTIDSIYASCERVKIRNPRKFNVMGLVFFSLILLISLFVNDFYFVYFSVMLLVSWPGLKHNHILERFFNIIKPHLTSLEKTLHIKKVVNKKKLKKKLDKKKKKSKKEEEKEEEEFVFSEDDSDIDLQQFLPTNLKTKVFPIYDNNDDDDDDAKEYLPHVETVSDDGDTDEEFFPDVEAFQKETSVKKKQKNKKSDVKPKHTKPNKKASNTETLTDDMLTQGLTFDNVDESTKQDTSSQPKKEETPKKSGFFGKAFEGFSLFKKAVSFGGAAKKDKEKVEEKIDDKEFEFFEEDLKDDDEF